MKIIDFRFRPHTRSILQGLAESPIFRDSLLSTGVNLKEFVNGAEEVPDIARALHKDNIAKAVLVGRDAETTYGFKSNNNEIKKFFDVDRDLFVAFAGLDPHKGMKAVYELEKRVEEDGFSGAAIDPIYNMIPVDHARFYPLYAKCVELDIPIVITTGPAKYTPSTTSSFAHPDMIDRVAADFPDLRIVVSHGAWPYVSEMIGVAFRNKNIFVEFSEYEEFPQGEAYIEAAKTILQDQIVFASAHPFVHYKDAIDLYGSFGFSEEIYKKVMYKNAAKILKINDIQDLQGKTNLDLDDIKVLLTELVQALK